MLVIVTLMCVAIVVWRAAAYVQARSTRVGSAAELASVHAQAQELITLRAQRPTSGVGARPSEDLLKTAQQIMRASALPEAKLKSVTPDAEASLPSDPRLDLVARKRQSVRLVLEPITPPELGSFLASLSREQAVWSVAGIDLSRAGGKDNIETSAAPNSAATPKPTLASSVSYRASLLLSATYVDEPARPAKATKGPESGGSSLNRPTPSSTSPTPIAPPKL
jgi:hypothetical protein